MLASVAKVASAFARLRAFDDEDVSNPDGSPMSALQQRTEQAGAQNDLESGAYEIVCELAKPLLLMKREVTTSHGVRYYAINQGCGMVVQKMNLNLADPGVVFLPDQTETKHWLQLMIDLPELLEILGVE